MKPLARVALAATLATALSAAAIAGAAGKSHPITIVINGDTLALDPPPRFEKNVLLVPVRRTIGALGLSYDQTRKRITTQIGSKTVTLTIGSRIATIDNRQVKLDSPPVEIANVLYVPLHFFTDVLGAQATFDRRANSVTIVAQLVGRSASGFSAVGNGFQRYGTVAAVDVLSDPPTLTLQRGGGVKTIPIAPNAVIDVLDVNVNVTSPGELSDVRPGDFARVEMRKDGRVQRIVDEYGSRNGRIVAVSGNQFVMGDGQVITAGRTTEVALNGKAAGFAQLQRDDQVTVRYNVETNEVREVLASRASTAPSAAQSQKLHITDVQSDATHPLRASDVIHVTLHGTPAAAATFDIGSDVTNQTMRESSPGVYNGNYAIPRGANFEGVALVGRLSSGDQQVEAPAPQLVSASSTPPGIADFAPDSGSVVNTNRPAVYASFAADAVPVNPSSASMLVNGRDVTSECVRTGQFIQYLPSYSYPDGNVRVTVRVADQAGNSTTKSWNFTIRTR